MNDPRYQLQIVSSARRHLTEDLPEAVAAAAFEFITGPLLENPHRVGKRLRAPLADRHSARRGTYRILYRIDDQARTVTVLAIGHRGDIYHA
ncbi:MAG: type II toxin-antitoxin system RelE/ParE family toxin [Pseudonocardia sp.]|nr:type II toxin-antitoxin system RelE/ParE family toxin [Pseudonocardia sp.]